MQGLVECFITGVRLECWGCLSVGWLALEGLVIRPGKTQLCPFPLTVLPPWRPSLTGRSCWWPGRRRSSRTCPEETPCFLEFVYYEIAWQIYSRTVVYHYPRVKFHSVKFRWASPWSGQGMSRWGHLGLHICCHWSKHPWRWNHPGGEESKQRVKICFLITKP